MEMRYFWVCDKVAKDAYAIKWHLGQENLADYQSKHYIRAHHQAVCPRYLHHDNSPSILPRASKPSSLKGCVGTLPEGYVPNVPLPRVPKIQRARSHQVTKIPDYYEDSYAVPTYDITCKLVESAAYAFSPTWHDIAINT
jgi:hypothetical protein